MEKITVRCDGKDIVVNKEDYEAVQVIAKKNRLDANETVFLIKELEYKKRRTYDTLYKELKYSKLLPISTEAPAGAKKILWDSYSKVGMAAVIAHYAQNAPRVEVYKEEFEANVRRVALHYGYDIDEIRHAQLAQVNLDSKRVDAARRGIESRHNTVAWSGDDEYGLQGFIDYPGILEYTVPATGTGTTKTWSTKTADQILVDLNGILNAGIETTNGIEVPNTIIMPIAQYNLIATTPRATVSDETILSFFMRTNTAIGRPITVDWLTELKEAGASTTDRYMAYNKNPDKLEYQMPMPYNQLPPQAEGFGFTVNAESKSGGVTVYYPYSIIFGDGI